MTETVHTCIALGSNLGDRRANITAAIDRIAETAGVEVIAISSMHETDAVGPGNQDRYINAAIIVWTDLPARQFLNRLLHIEHELGRVRDPQAKWGPRSIDLDLLLHGEQIIAESGLQVPHPAMHERAFVLDPLVEIAPDHRHPVLGKSVQELHRCLPGPRGSTVE